MPDTLHLLIKREFGYPGTELSVQFEQPKFKNKFEALKYYKDVYNDELFYNHEEEDVDRILRKIDKAMDKLRTNGDENTISLKVLNFKLYDIISHSATVISSGKWDEFFKTTIDYLLKDINQYIKEKKDKLGEQELNLLIDEKNQIKLIKLAIKEGKLTANFQLPNFIDAMIKRRQSDA